MKTTAELFEELAYSFDAMEQGLITPYEVARSLRDPDTQAPFAEAMESLRAELDTAIADRDAALAMCEQEKIESKTFRHGYCLVSNRLAELAASVDELKTICAEAYQVVGVLAAECGRFDDAHVTKILDNLSDQKMIHADVLPFPSKEASK